MKRCMLFFLLGLSAVYSFSQRIVFDKDHFNIVNENGLIRLGSENIHQLYLKNINARLEDINLNISSLVLLERMVFNSLSLVNQNLKTAGLASRMIALSHEIIYESEGMLELAKSDPLLLLFAEAVIRQLKERSARLVNEVYGLVLKEGENLLMDYEKRDALLKKINLELQVIRALVFSIKKSMQIARANGILKSANPFSSFINQDKRIAGDVFFKYKIITKK